MHISKLLNVFALTGNIKMNRKRRNNSTNMYQDKGGTASQPSISKVLIYSDMFQRDGKIMFVCRKLRSTNVAIRGVDLHCIQSLGNVLFDLAQPATMPQISRALGTRWLKVYFTDKDSG